MKHPLLKLVLPLTVVAVLAALTTVGIAKLIGVEIDAPVLAAIVAATTATTVASTRPSGDADEAPSEATD